MYAQYIPPLWSGSAERLDGSEVKGEVPTHHKGLLNLPHLTIRGLTNLVRQFGICERDCGPPLTSRKAALLQEPGWVRSSVLGWGRGGWGSRKAAPHSLAQSKQFSKGTVSAALCAGLFTKAESQSQTDFVPLFSYNATWHGFSCSGWLKQVPTEGPMERSEFNFRQHHKLIEKCNQDFKLKPKNGGKLLNGCKGYRWCCWSKLKSGTQSQKNLHSSLLWSRVSSSFHSTLFQNPYCIKPWQAKYMNALKQLKRRNLHTVALWLTTASVPGTCDHRETQLVLLSLPSKNLTNQHLLSTHCSGRQQLSPPPLTSLSLSAVLELENNLLHRTGRLVPRAGAVAGSECLSSPPWVSPIVRASYVSSELINELFQDN